MVYEGWNNGPNLLFGRHPATTHPPLIKAETIDFPEVISKQISIFPTDHIYDYIHSVITIDVVSSTLTLKLKAFFQ